MRYELVHRLTLVGRRYAPASTPDRTYRRRVGALARAAVRTTAVAALLAAACLGAALAAAVVAGGPAGLSARPLVAWFGVVVAAAATPALVARLPAALRVRS